MDAQQFAPPDPTLPKTLDLEKCRKYINGAPRYSRLPVGDMIQDMADQMRLLMEDAGGASAKVSAAQGDTIRYQREAQQAAGELITLRQELIDARKKIEELTPKVAAPVVAPTPKKRGPKGKVVQMDAGKAAAQ